MDSEALQRGFQALEDELGQIVPQRRTPAERRQRRTQGGRRKTRSDKKPPDYINPATGLPTWSNRGSRCWNRGGYIVCNDPPNGSRGQAGVYQKRGERGDRGDPDMKGRDKTEAIKENRTVIRKYDDDGKITKSVGLQNYFTPIGEQGGIVYLQPGINERGDVFGGSAFTDLSDFDKKDLIAVSKDDFNAQYRVHRGIENPRDIYDTLINNEYELGEPIGGTGTRPSGMGAASARRQRIGEEQEYGVRVGFDPEDRESRLARFRLQEDIFEEAKKAGGGRAGLIASLRQAAEAGIREARPRTNYLTEQRERAIDPISRRKARQRRRRDRAFNLEPEGEYGEAGLIRQRRDDEDDEEDEDRPTAAEIAAMTTQQWRAYIQSPEGRWARP